MTNPNSASLREDVSVEEIKRILDERNNSQGYLK